jgi:hypothetical protein
MYPRPYELLTASYVEQKLIFPLLTNPAPTGLAFAPSDIATKLSISRLEIGKGTARELYSPATLLSWPG